MKCEIVVIGVGGTGSSKDKIRSKDTVERSTWMTWKSAV